MRGGERMENDKKTNMCTSVAAPGGATPRVFSVAAAAACCVFASFFYEGHKCSMNGKALRSLGAVDMRA